MMDRKFRANERGTKYWVLMFVKRVGYLNCRQGITVWISHSNDTERIRWNERANQNTKGSVQRGITGRGVLMCVERGLTGCSVLMRIERVG